MTGASGRPHLGGVVLTGGGAARLGGADKATIELGGRTLLEHSLAALTGVDEVVVAGAEVPTSRPVTFTREEPAGGGPAAGLLAALGRFARPPAYVVVLAVDMPLVSGETVDRLAAAATASADGAVLVDGTGRRQYLCAAYSVASLEAARRASAEGSGHGLSMRRLVEALDLASVPAVGPETRDLDTWEDLVALRETFGDDRSAPPGGHGSSANA